MQNPNSSVVFDQKRADSYDKQFVKLSALRDGLHLLARMVLSELPADARILCVGVGTGLELADLAQAFPGWQFTAVEPSKPMLDICRGRAREYGIESRCTFHEGYLDSLPASDAFDAATCLLVSHFLLQQEERRQFFCRIAARLRPGGYLVSADLAFDVSTPAYPDLLGVWQRVLRYAELPAEVVEKVRATFAQDVAVLPPREVESIIVSSGFDAPVLFFQACFIHAWYTRRTS